MTFDECFDALLVHEGEYADLENDPGGKTRYGVTEAVARSAGLFRPRHRLRGSVDSNQPFPDHDR